MNNVSVPIVLVDELLEWIKAADQQLEYEFGSGETITDLSAPDCYKALLELKRQTVAKGEV